MVGLGYSRVAAGGFSPFPGEIEGVRDYAEILPLRPTRAGFFDPPPLKATRGSWYTMSFECFCDVCTSSQGLADRFRNWLIAVGGGHGTFNG
jgi:hypothetical protein